MYGHTHTLLKLGKRLVHLNFYIGIWVCYFSSGIITEQFLMLQEMRTFITASD